MTELESVCVEDRAALVEAIPLKLPVCDCSGIVRWVCAAWATTVVFAIVLGVSVGSYYIPERDKMVSTQCAVNVCDVLQQTCSNYYCSTTGGSSSNCYTTYYTCYSIYVQFTIPVLNITTSATKSTSAQDAYDACTKPAAGAWTIPCFYFSDNPLGSASLTESWTMGGPIATVVVFTVFLCCALSAAVGTSYCWWRDL